ncbi:MAG TPA: ankyrin repeat domain-containing protein [Vicinamibacterales bacterium]|jgi:ankyrin repeat protein|nr:ankyrin repeat domain-containing protein [Vicinamibacterales bacterium]
MRIKHLAPVALAVLLIIGMGAGGERLSLVDAAKNGDKAELRALLQKKADVNAAQADGTTALHWAAYKDDVESADLLIHAGAKVNASNDLGVTPLWTAAQNGSEAMVACLLAAGANPNAALLAGETAVMVASRSGNPAVVEQLIAKGGDVNVHGARGQTALMWAASQKHPEVLKVLLSHGADVKAKSDVWSQVMAVPPHGYLDYNRTIPAGGETPLMFAARVGDLESAKLLVAAGAGVNDADAWGISATTLAAHSGYTELVAFLLDKGADPNQAPNGFTALHEAIMRHDEKMAAALLDHGADASTPLKTWTPTRRSSHDYNFPPEFVGATPFWLAARFDEPNVMRLLLKHGADPMFVLHADHVVAGRGGQGWEHRADVTTALMAATGIGGGAAWVDAPRAQREAQTLEAVKLAVELGIDINAANVDGRTALDGAQALKYSSVIKFLEEKGAKASGKKGPAPREEI